jgi:hypothetical protein
MLLFSVLEKIRPGDLSWTFETLYLRQRFGVIAQFTKPYGPVQPHARLKLLLKHSYVGTQEQLARTSSSATV